MGIHSRAECKQKCEAIKEILTRIQQAAGMESQYDIRHLAESGLDLVRDLKGEMAEDKE
jgi:hypothetical protein